MKVQPIGEAVFKVDDQTYRIGADALKQHDLIQTSSATYKDGTEDWSVSFSAAHEVGEFTWQAYFSMGASGASLDSVELIKRPASVEMIRDMAFKLV